MEAEEYEKRYETIDDSRKKQLTSRIKETMNKIREETSTILTKELFDFLNGQEQKVGHQNIRILNEEGKQFFFESKLFSNFYRTFILFVQTCITYS